MLSVLLFQLCDYWKAVYPNYRQFSDSCMNPFDCGKFKLFLHFRYGNDNKNKERTFISDCLKVNPEERLTIYQLKGKSLFSTELPTSHTNHLKSIKEDTSTIIQNQTTVLSHSVDLKKKIGNLESMISNSITDCNEEIKSSLEEMRLGLSEDFKRSHNDLINRIMLIEKGGNANREELINLLNELKKFI